MPSSQRPGNQDNASLSAAWQSVKSSVLPVPQPQPARRTATLAVQDGTGFANDPVPLGIHVGAPPPDAFVSINGLTAGARLTSGKRVGPSEWRVPATEISGVSVIPPDGFTGQMLVTAELRDGNGVALTGTSTRLTWTPVPTAAPPLVAAPAPVAAAPVAAPPPPVAVAAAVPVPAAPRQAEVVRSLDPKEIAALIKRGQDLLAAGDVQSARLLLMRGAEARDARAALLVGTTYDPARLRQMGADGPLADVAQARTWYQRAKEWGEPDAQRQLDALALSR
ncbi:sel1 repeat family protein [Bradyrhizobium sp. WSM 1791]|uniref:Sel1 repeat family protein n=1 Tax=Bradyrhizobium australiense TaxID=2721161 RepID=A0A7Y4LU47_9BRAD|nr:sel1 repeat family protein [Bradyrhizobium australiense]